MAAATISPIPIYAIYKDPSDYPGLYVVRRWYTEHLTEEPLIVTPNLGDARLALPMGLANVGRQQGDDPAILEVWL